MNKVICRTHNFKPGLMGNKECMQCRFEKGQLEKSQFILIPRLFDGHFHNQHIEDFEKEEADNDRVVLTRRERKLESYGSHKEATPAYLRDSDDFGVYKKHYCFVDGWAFVVLVGAYGPKKYCDEFEVPRESEIIPFIMDVINGKTPQ